MSRKAHKPADEIFDSIPGIDKTDVSTFYKGAHVRQYMSKLRTRVSGPSGEILYFVNPTIKGKKVWRAFVAWRPEEGEHYDQFVDVDLLRLESTPPPPRKSETVEPEPESEPEPEEDSKKCHDCKGDLKFDPDLVGDTVGGLTLRGWMVCQKCGKGWLAPKGMATVYEGPWKLASGGRSVETGNGRIRVDGGNNVEALMARIVKLPELELEVAQLRKYRAEQEALAKESETVTKVDDAFCKLQREVYDFLMMIRPGEWDRKDVEKARVCLHAITDRFHETDEHQLNAAIQYAIKYGRMP